MTVKQIRYCDICGSDLGEEPLAPKSRFWSIKLKGTACNYENKYPDTRDTHLDICQDCVYRANHGIQFAKSANVPTPEALIKVLLALGIIEDKKIKGDELEEKQGDA